MINVSRTGSMSVLLSNGEHEIISDVAKELGGEDEGLNPHELVEAALGACTSLTIEMYAKRKNWDVKDLKVEVKIIVEGPESGIERNISFGDMPEENKKRLIEIANKCPIHKLLESNIKIETYEK
jgi:putative redox protein